MATNILRRLPTALQIATARARQIARAEFAKRLDPAAYRCWKEGEGDSTSWLAVGAGQCFDYSKTEGGEVLCISGSGSIYLLTVQDDGALRCDCPARQNADQCKHEVGFQSVRMAHAMEREETQRALRAEAREMPPLCPRCLEPRESECPCVYAEYYEGEGLETEWSFADGSPRFLPQEDGRRVGTWG